MRHAKNLKIHLVIVGKVKDHLASFILLISQSNLPFNGKSRSFILTTCRIFDIIRPVITISLLQRHILYKKEIQHVFLECSVQYLKEKLPNGCLPIKYRYGSRNWFGVGRFSLTKINTRWYPKNVCINFCSGIHQIYFLLFDERNDFKKLTLTWAWCFHWKHHDSRIPSIRIG
jgi:hypothetical protein